MRGWNRELGSEGESHCIAHTPSLFPFVYLFQTILSRKVSHPVSLLCIRQTLSSVHILFRFLTARMLHTHSFRETERDRERENKSWCYCCFASIVLSLLLQPALHPSDIAILLEVYSTQTYSSYPSGREYITVCVFLTFVFSLSPILSISLERQESKEKKIPTDKQRWRGCKRQRNLFDLSSSKQWVNQCNRGQEPYLCFRLSFAIFISTNICFQGHRQQLINPISNRHPVVSEDVQISFPPPWLCIYSVFCVARGLKQGW